MPTLPGAVSVRVVGEGHDAAVEEQLQGRADHVELQRRAAHRSAVRLAVEVRPNTTDIAENVGGVTAGAGNDRAVVHILIVRAGITGHQTGIFSRRQRHRRTHRFVSAADAVDRGQVESTGGTSPRGRAVGRVHLEAANLIRPVVVQLRVAAGCAEVVAIVRRAASSSAACTRWRQSCRPPCRCRWRDLCRVHGQHGRDARHSAGSKVAVPRFVLPSRVNVDEIDRAASAEEASRSATSPWPSRCRAGRCRCSARR